MKKIATVSIKFRFDFKEFENTISDSAMRELLRTWASVHKVNWMEAEDDYTFISLTFPTPRGDKTISGHVPQDEYMKVKRATARAVMITRFAEAGI